MKEKMVLYIFVLLIYQHFTEVLSCPTSTATISYVSSCPINQEEWEKASKMKNCEGIAAIQNCTTPAKFVYHCLMNHWRNATLEVCAPIFYIQGYCAEYNTRVKQVVENYNEGFECLTFPEPQRCPPRYASNEAYKYQACYSYQHKQTTTAKSVVTDVIYITKESRSEDNGVECLEFIIVLGLLLPLFLFVLVLGFVINREQIFKLLPEGCTSRCPSMPSGNQSSEAEKGEITQLLGDHDSEKDPVIDLPDIKTNAIMNTISEKDTENIYSQFKEQNIKTSLPDERKDSSDEESNAPTVSDKPPIPKPENVQEVHLNDEAPESIGNKSTNQSIKTPLPEEEKSSTNMESSAPTVFAPLPEEEKSSINLKLSVPTVSGTDTESIGNKSTGQSIEISLPGEEKSSTNVESSVPNEHDPPPILRSENTQGSHVNEEDTGNIDNKSTEQNIKAPLQEEEMLSTNVELSALTKFAPSPDPRSENAQESHVNEKDTESIANKSTEQSIKTPMSDEQKVFPSMKSSAPTQSEDAIAIKKSEKDQEGHVNEKDTESIDYTSTEQSMRTPLPDEQTVLPSTESSAPTQSGKDTKRIGKGSIEQNMKTTLPDKQNVLPSMTSSAPTQSDASLITKSENVQEGTDTESIGNKSTGQSIETTLPDEQTVSPSTESSASTQSDASQITKSENVQDTESIDNKSTEQSIETTLPDQQNVLPSMKSSATTQSETDTEGIANKSIEQSMKTPLPDQQTVLPSMTSSAATQSDQDIASLNENPSNSKAVERPIRKSKKAPLPPPKDTPESIEKNDGKHSTASVSKLGKNKQAPSVPPGKVNKSKT